MAEKESGIMTKIIAAVVPHAAETLNQYGVWQRHNRGSANDNEVGYYFIAREGDRSALISQRQLLSQGEIAAAVAAAGFGPITEQQVVVCDIFHIANYID